MKRKTSFLIFILLLFSSAAFAHHPRFVNTETTHVREPEISQAFYAEMNGKPQSYQIESDESFELFVQLLVPDITDARKDVSAEIFQNGTMIAEIDGLNSQWQAYYEEFGGDRYYTGPEFKQNVSAGAYTIMVHRPDNMGKYVFVVGSKEVFTPKDIWNDTIRLPRLKEYFEKPRYTAYFNTSGRFLLLSVLTPAMALNGDDMPSGRKEMILGTILNQFGAILHGSSDQTTNVLFTPDIHMVRSWQLSRDTMVLDNIFQTQNGAVSSHLKSRGGQTGISFRLSNNTELSYNHLDFSVDSYSNNAITGASHGQGNLFSFKTAFPGSKDMTPGRFKFGLQYKFLDNSNISGIHFADIYAGTILGKLETTIGFSSYSGSGADNESGMFANLSYNANDDLTVFTEYSNSDFLKAIQKNLLAPAARNIANISASDTPNSALSAGFVYNLENGSFIKLALYDLDFQTKSYVQFSLAR
ncbi:MAG: hypothetical protein WCX65_11155 [bacterium]